MDNRLSEKSRHRIGSTICLEAERLPRCSALSGCVKQRDAAVLVHMLERGAAEQAAAVSEDCARMHALRTSLKRAAEDMRRLC